MKQILSFLLPLFILMACQKEEESQLPPEYLGDHTIMKGRVTDPWGMPIAEAEVSCKVLAGIPYRDEYTFWIPGIPPMPMGIITLNTTTSRRYLARTWLQKGWGYEKYTY